MPQTPLCTYPYTEWCNHNNVAEGCYVQTMPGHCNYYPAWKEPCDGADVPSCESLGFTGGTTTCVDCKINTSQCTQ